MLISEKIWLEYQARLRVFVRGKVFDDAATDDILQDVFLKMHFGLPSLRDKAKLKSWLYQIARNAIADYCRSQKPTVDISEWLPQPEADTAGKATKELSECLRPMIRRLPENYREAISLSELQGLPQKEVAELQGISLSGAKSRVQRGRILLKTMLAECCQLEFDQGGRLCDYERQKGTGDNCC